MRLHLATGRRAEIDLTGVEQLEAVLGALDRQTMMRPAPDVTVYLCVAPVDMRKQAASLGLLVQQSLGRNVFDALLYVFTDRKRDRVRIVYWGAQRSVPMKQTRGEAAEMLRKTFLL